MIMLTIDDLKQERDALSRRMEIELNLINHLIDRASMQCEFKELAKGGIASPEAPAQAGAQPRAVSNPRKVFRADPNAKKWRRRDARKGKTGQVVCAIGHVPSPFTVTEVRDYLKAHGDVKFVGSMLSSIVWRLNNNRVLLKSGTKNGLQAYIPGPEIKNFLAAGESGESKVKRAYQAIRAEVDATQKTANPDESEP
jgi:hypothetical protein